MRRERNSEPRNYTGKVTTKAFKIASQDSSMAKDQPLTADLLLTLLTFFKKISRLIVLPMVGDMLTFSQA